jgi:hypothetical protein
VSVYSKNVEDKWVLTDYDGDENIAIIHNMNDCPLPLKRLYYRMNE